MADGSGEPTTVVIIPVAVLVAWNGLLQLEA